MILNISVDLLDKISSVGVFNALVEAGRTAAMAFERVGPLEVDQSFELSSSMFDGNIKEITLFRSE